MKHSLIIVGALFGLIAPVLGLFIGLQVSPAVGTILIFPFILASLIADIPVGHFGASIWIALFLVSCLVWAAIFSMFSYLWCLLSRKRS